MNQKLNYLIRSGIGFFRPHICPHCGSTKASLVDQKYIVTRLFACDVCHLQYRHPTDTNAFNEKFYQSDYTQDDGITTDLPSPTALEKMISEDFSGSAKNAAHVIDLWLRLVPNAADIKAVDYGCSWGYMSYQFLKRGIQTQSFEISRPRAAFGNKHLQLDIKSNVNDLYGNNNLFYSSHVIEHVPSIADMLGTAKRLLSREGFFVAECPNGSAAFRARNGSGFHQGWGLVHPNYLSDEFYKTLFNKNPYFITSTPFDLAGIERWDRRSQYVGDTSGGELLVIAVPNFEL